MVLTMHVTAQAVFNSLERVVLNKAFLSAPIAFPGGEDDQRYRRLRALSRKNEPHNAVLLQDCADALTLLRQAIHAQTDPAYFQAPAGARREARRRQRLASNPNSVSLFVDAEQSVAMLTEIRVRQEQEVAAALAVVENALGILRRVEGSLPENILVDPDED